MKREDRIDAVHALMLAGEHRVSKITRTINRQNGTRCQQETISKDMKEVYKRNDSWQENVTKGGASLRARHFHGILVKNVDMLEDAIETSLTTDPAKGAYRAAQLYPQLLASIQAIWDLEEKFPMYQTNAKLHTRLKEKEAELEKQLAKAGALKAEDSS